MAKSVTFKAVWRTSRHNTYNKNCEARSKVYNMWNLLLLKCVGLKANFSRTIERDKFHVRK